MNLNEMKKKKKMKIIISCCSKGINMLINDEANCLLKIIAEGQFDTESNTKTWKCLNRESL